MLRVVLGDRVEETEYLAIHFWVSRGNNLLCLCKVSSHVTPLNIGIG